MQQNKVSPAPATAVAPPNVSLNPVRLLLTIAVPVVTLFILYQGFVYLRDSSAPQWFITIFAIVWGVGGVAALYYVANWVVEQLPPRLSAQVQPYIFVGPALALLAWYLAVPTIRTLLLSLQNANSSAFVGLDNYLAVLTESDMQRAWTNNLLWMLVGTAMTVTLGLLIAILADRSRFENVAKSLIFMPMAISMVGAGVIWNMVYDANPNVGLINGIVTGLGGEAQAWVELVQPWNNLFLIIVMVWLQTGYAMVLISAAIKAIPEELLEAARVDGANEVEIFFQIILPNIAPTLLTVVTTVVIFTLKLFDIVMVMTGGNYGTEVVGVQFYREMFTARDAGKAGAIAIVLLLAVVPIMIYNLRQFSQRRSF